jgi:hypothetical protein
MQQETKEKLKITAYILVGSLGLFFLSYMLYLYLRNPFTDQIPF